MVKIYYVQDQKRSAAYDDGRLIGACDYSMPGSYWIITHTQTDPAYAGQGIAADLVQCVMQAAEAADVKVKPICSYAEKLFTKIPEYALREEKSVIRVYTMKTCHECIYVKAQIQDNANFEVIDIGEQVQNLKAFLKIRDNSPVFADVRINGYVGIPCFVMEDGAVTITPEEVGLRSEPVQDGQACKLDGTGC